MQLRFVTLNCPKMWIRGLVVCVYASATFWTEYRRRSVSWNCSSAKQKLDRSNRITCKITDIVWGKNAATERVLWRLDWYVDKKNLCACVMEHDAPFKCCTPHPSRHPLYICSHSNSTRSTNRKRGLGRKKDGRVLGAVVICDSVWVRELSWCSKTFTQIKAHSLAYILKCTCKNPQ